MKLSIIALLLFPAVQAADKPQETVNFTGATNWVATYTSILFSGNSPKCSWQYALFEDGKCKFNLVFDETFKDLKCVATDNGAVCTWTPLPIADSKESK